MQRTIPIVLGLVLLVSLVPFTAEPAMAQKRGTIEIYFQQIEGYQELAEGLDESDVFEEVAAFLASEVVLPVNLTVLFQACGQPNAFYSADDLQVVMCYEFFDLFGQIFYEPGISDEDLGLAILGAGVFFYLHEMGHALVHVLDLPITGREEDAVDDLASIALIGEDAEDALASALMSFAAMSDYMESGDVELPFWDEHSLHAQRVYNIACLMFGSNPQAYAEMTGPDGLLPVERAARCEQEFAQKLRAWDRLLQPHYP